MTVALPKTTPNIVLFSGYLHCASAAYITTGRQPLWDRREMNSIEQHLMHALSDNWLRPHDSFYSPLFPLAVLLVVFAVSWAAVRFVPMLNAELRTENASRLTPLDGLRGLLCFCVMAHHSAYTHCYLQTGLWGPLNSPFFELLGEMAVCLFFSVTGYLFWSRAIALQGQLNAVEFLRARVFRVGPMYVCSIVFAAAALFHYVQLAPMTVTKGVIRTLTLGIKSFDAPGFHTIGDVTAHVAWTLKFEWAFYLALPALALFVNLKRVGSLLFLLAAMCTIYGCDQYVFFIPGMVAAHVSRDERIVLQLRRSRAAVVVLIALLLLPALTDAAYGYVGFAATVIIFVPIACGNSLFGFLNLSGLRLMGLVSYSVYLIHGIALFVARPLLARMATGADSLRAQCIFWACTAVLAVIVLLVSIATYHLIELPFIRMEKRFRRGPRTDQVVVAKTAVPSAVVGVV